MKDIYEVEKKIYEFNRKEKQSTLIRYVIITFNLILAILSLKFSLSKTNYSIYFYIILLGIIVFMSFILLLINRESDSRQKELDDFFWNSLKRHY